MSIADELKKLEGLRWNGTLTDTEFAHAKAAILAQLGPAPEPRPDPVAEAQARHRAATRYRDAIERIDREWEQERERHLVTAKDGRQYAPTTGEGFSAAIAVGVFGGFWTAMAFGITSQFPSNGPFVLAKVLFPLIGIGVAAYGIKKSVREIVKAQAFGRAYAAYQRRRAALNPDSFR
ncbi:hypothetical protein GobsT_10920 [Gemmata obscuriglobus]|uniref:SHOCT domain-containing protein n=1 Tax=Gemmata obscuriglobus TaxID=114 RepID=A0A2Z3HG80_9BACT|nr:hypothetical protein [Gemmata obscuriglobus]AWM40410.1 hypothetical protein C1280_27780 [Gemmata obscuriglobus]QEG26353.1 hypothetical protein GobsT_10920 [Gemmata obscuriglobus]VTS01349.1 Putative membrane protein OS=Rhodopirellula maiorica SM1 GN=RMSM_07553 PE=4 SV=1 [Gemmata obscuriglobus UQM 2246]